MPDAKLASIPALVLPAKYKDRAAFPLPRSVDNTKLPWFPPFDWTIQGYSCASAASVSYVFEYEMRRARKLPAGGLEPVYTYEFTNHFLNNGDQAKGGDGWHFVESFDILKEVGGATSADFDGFEFGNFTGAWMSGYDKYYAAMKARVREYYKIDASKPENDEIIKQYLHDHADGSDAGGLLVFQANGDDGGWDEAYSQGRRIITRFNSGGGHAMVIAGYDDAFQGGSWLVVNNWGEGSYWAQYKHWKAGGGLFTAQGTPAMLCRLRENYAPQITFKITLTHDQRNSIAILTGVAPSQSAAAPTRVKDYAGAFNFSGGAYPMLGMNQGATIEIGLDLTDFAPQLTGKEGRFFLQIVSKGGMGKIDNVTLMDYSGGQVREIPGTEPGKAIAPNATTTISIPWSGTLAVKPRPASHAPGPLSGGRDLRSRKSERPRAGARPVRPWVSPSR